MNYASDFRAVARDALSGNWRTAILTGFVASLMGATLWGGGGGSSSADSDSLSDTLFYALDNRTLQIILTVLSITAIVLILWGIAVFVIGGAAKLGYAVFNLNLVDGKPARFSDLFSQFGRIGSGIIMNLLVGIYTLLWSMLFVIPGIVKAYSYAMTPFILAEHPEISENAAITRSRELMDGNKWRLFCLMFSFIGWDFLSSTPLAVAIIALCGMIMAGMTAKIPFFIALCIVTFLLFFVGQLFLFPYRHAALAAFYRDISTGIAQEEPPFPGEVN